MRALGVALVVLVIGCVGCGDDGGGTETVVEIEPFSPPQLRPNILQPTRAVRGDLVILADRMSLDGGKTWRMLNPETGGLIDVLVYSDTSAVVRTPMYPLMYWDLATDTLYPVNDVPTGFTNRTPCVTSANTWIVPRYEQNGVARKRPNVAWTTQMLPSPATATTYIFDWVCNGTTVVLATSSGLFNSVDDGVTFNPIANAPNDFSANDLERLPDGRLILFGNNEVGYLLDSTGVPTGESTPPFQGAHNTHYVCDDGAIISYLTGNYTKDLGQSWHPIVPPTGTGPIKAVESVACGNGARYYNLRTWTYPAAFVKVDSIGDAPRAVANWESEEPGFPVNGTDTLGRYSDGTFWAGEMRWQEGDAAWSFEQVDGQYKRRGSDLYAFGEGVWVTRDKTSWSMIPSDGTFDSRNDTYGVAPNGDLYLGYVNTTSIDATIILDNFIWKLPVGTTQWINISDTTYTHYPDGSSRGENRPLIEITPDGAILSIAEISYDDGASWTPLPWKAPAGRHTETRAVGITPSGVAYVMRNEDNKPLRWLAYDDNGRGDLLATYEFTANGGHPLDHAQLKFPVFDEAGYLYFYSGAPYRRIFRTKTPLEH